MKTIWTKRITALLLVALLAGLWPIPARAEAAGEITVYSDLNDISKYGNVRVVINGRVLEADLKKVGIEYGDSVQIRFLDQTLRASVVRDFSEVESGAVLLRLKGDAVELAINTGDFAATYFADMTSAEDGSFSWAYKEGIEGPVAFRITLLSKAGEDGTPDPIGLAYTNSREDYPNLSDEEFANFRVVATTGLGDGILCRSSSPVNPVIHRNRFADAALKEAGVVTVLNLADTRNAMEAFEGYRETYYAAIDVLPLNMGMSLASDDFRAKLAEGLRFLCAHEGPYAIHCREGKDRTGLVAALLECFMGATLDEVTRDYMLSFYNYYGIRPGDDLYDMIVENNICKNLRSFFEVDDLAQADLALEAEEYFLSLGLSDAALDALRENLSQSAADAAKAAA